MAPACASTFDFDAAVTAPFRMQPGLRRMAAGALHLTPLGAGSRAQREKLAVLSAFWPQALCTRPGFDAAPAIQAVCAHAAQEHPAHWQWDAGRRSAQAAQLGVAVSADGSVEQLRSGVFGNGDEVARCLNGLPLPWRLPGLLCLVFAEDLAVLDASDASVPWMAVTLPSFWAPEAKVGLPFAAIHAPVADNQRLLQAADQLVHLVTTAERWERFVWTITDHSRLHAHPARVAPQRWLDTTPAQAWFRSERQTFLPVATPGTTAAGLPLQAVFTIAVELQPLSRVAAQPERRQALAAAVASMSPAVLAYRGLQTVSDELLQWLRFPVPDDRPVLERHG